MLRRSVANVQRAFDDANKILQEHYVGIKNGYGVDKATIKLGDSGIPEIHCNIIPEQVSTDRPLPDFWEFWVPFNQLYNEKIPIIKNIQSAANVAPSQVSDTFIETFEHLKLEPKSQISHKKERAENYDSEDDEYEKVRVISNIDELLSDNDTESEDNLDSAMEEETEEFTVESAFFSGESDAFLQPRNSITSLFSNASSIKHKLSGITEETDDDLESEANDLALGKRKGSFNKRSGPGIRS